MIPIVFLSVCLSSLLGVALGFVLAREEMRDMTFDELFCFWRSLQEEKRAAENLERQDRER